MEQKQTFKLLFAALAVMLAALPFVTTFNSVAVIVVILAVSRPLFAVVFHDYLAAIVTILWLFVFWYFAYAFVLESKEEVA